MLFPIVLIATIAFCFAFHKVIQMFPVAFYFLAFCMDAAYAAGAAGLLPHEASIALMPLMQKCTLSLAFFFVVMGIGAFTPNGAVGSRLRPIRAELSIIACILAMGHMFVYLQTYLSGITSGATHSSNVIASLVVALALLALLSVLGITSLGLVKRRMGKQKWASLQKWAYVFFALVLVHLLLMLTPSALKGSQTAFVALAMYLALFAAYGIARVWRYSRDRAVHTSSLEFDDQLEVA